MCIYLYLSLSIYIYIYIYIYIHIYVGITLYYELTWQLLNKCIQALSAGSTAFLEEARELNTYKRKRQLHLDISFRTLLLQLIYKRLIGDIPFNP